MGFVMHQKTREHAIEFGSACGFSFERKPALNHDARAMADDVPHRAERHPFETDLVENEVQCRAKIGCGIDERAVEVESDSRPVHGCVHGAIRYPSSAQKSTPRRAKRR